MSIKSGIYLIKIHTYFYVGSATYVQARKGRHYFDLKNNKHHNSKLQNVFNKYGFKNLQFSVLEYCSKTDLIKREQYWIDLYFKNHGDFVLNLCKIAGNTTGIQVWLGKKHKESTKGLQSKRRFETLRSVNEIVLNNQKAVIQYNLKGEKIADWVSCTHAGDSLEIVAANISRCAKHNKPKSAGGFIWRFKVNGVDQSKVDPINRLSSNKYTKWENI